MSNTIIEVKSDDEGSQLDSDDTDEDFMELHLRAQAMTKSPGAGPLLVR